MLRKEISIGLTILALTAPAAPAMAQVASNGAALFKQRCQSCHTVTDKAGLMGPSLAGVVGRKAASTAFSYSPALKSANLTWDKATLDKFITAPMKMVPGTRMVISVPDAKQRADLIAYFSTFSKKK